MSTDTMKDLMDVTKDAYYKISNKKQKFYFTVVIFYLEKPYRRGHDNH